MPQPAVHLLVAAGVLDNLRATATTRTPDTCLARFDGRHPFDAHDPDAGPAPFDARDQEAANAFLLGSLGPDMGYFPAGSNTFSRLAHSARTARLVRSLLHRAATPGQRAFAWGWLTHMLADIHVHPLVNRAAAEHGTAAGRTAGAPHLDDHVRVEVGLDAWFAWRDPALRKLRLQPAFDTDSIRFIADAYAEVHHHRLTTYSLLQMQLATLHFTHLALHFVTSMARTLCWDAGGTAGTVPATHAMVWRVASALARPRTVTRAYLNPVMPAAWLVADVDTALGQVRAGFHAAVQGGLLLMPDYSLEDGSVLPDADMHAA
jgi:hypothetical protein